MYVCMCVYECEYVCVCVCICMCVCTYIFLSFLIVNYLPLCDVTSDGILEDT